LGIPLTMVFPPRSKFFTHADRATATRTTWSSQKHRAESMKKALVDRYQISANRLTTAGFGASRPKATNDTVEGRALNRRVELVRRIACYSLLFSPAARHPW